MHANTLPAPRERKRIPVRLAIRWLVRLVLVAVLLAATLLAVAVGALLFAEDLPPLTLPRTVLTNGTKTGVFESMIHVAAPAFYARARRDVQELKRDGYAYFYEGVRPGSGAVTSSDVLEAVTAGKLRGVDLGTVYALLAESAGLVPQPGANLTGDLGDRNIDASVDELMPDVQRAMRSAAPPSRTNDAAEFEQGFGKLRAFLAEASEERRRLVRTMVRSAMHLVVLAGPERLGPQVRGAMDALLTRRNQIVAGAIAGGPDRIVVTYGVAHLDGILAEVQRTDPKWHVATRTERRVFAD